MDNNQKISDSIDELSNKISEVMSSKTSPTDANRTFEASCSHEQDVQTPLQDDNEEDSSSETDNIDEEYLKEIEETLSEEDKEKRRTEAQSLKSKGNEFFKDCQYESAVKCYSQALNLCPLIYSKDRSVLYSNRAACRQYMDNIKAAIADSTKALELDPHYVKALQRRAKLYETDEKLDEALEDYKNILQIEPANQVALEACHYLPPKIEERNEKLKEEMMGKLKDLGNMILKPFGLSTENFQLQKDPSTGNYSVNFKKE